MSSAACKFVFLCVVFACAEDTVDWEELKMGGIRGDVNGDDKISAVDALMVLKSVKEDGEELLVPIEDDEEYESVAKIFTERLKDIFNFES